MDKRLAGLLGLAMRARKISMGDSLFADIRLGKAKLVLIGCDASKNTIKKISDKCRYYHIEFGFVESTEELSQAIGKPGRVAIAILDEGFAKAIKEYI